MKLDLVETECSCDDCKAMCRAPCVGTPKEMQKIIDAGFGKRLCFDDLPGGSTLIKPALKGDEGKRSRWETRSEEGCTFWINGKCELHNLKLKPLGGKIAHHDQTDENYEKLHDFLEKSWNKKQAKTIINNWKKINLYKD